MAAARFQRIRPHVLPQHWVGDADCHLHEKSVSKRPRQFQQLRAAPSSWNDALLLRPPHAVAPLKPPRPSWGPKNLPAMLNCRQRFVSCRGWLRKRPIRLGVRRAAASNAQSATSASEIENTSSKSVDYTVRIETSRSAGSSLSEAEGGVMVALLGAAGKFLLRKLVAQTDGTRNNEATEKLSLTGNFEVGATAEMRFKDVSIGSIESVWLSPMSGHWRPAAASVLVMPSSSKSAPEVHGDEIEPSDSQAGPLETSVEQGIEMGLNKAEGEKRQAERDGSVLYSFKWNEGLIGEGCEETAAQLVSGAVHTGEALSQLESVKSSSLEELAASRAAGLAEYEDLKVFLLGTTAALAGLGSLGSKLAFGDEVSIGFAVGGFSGLLYLLLLQRTVDQLGRGGGAQAGDVLQSIENPSETKAMDVKEGPLGKVLNRVAMIAKGPASRLLLVALLVLVAVKFAGAGEVRGVEPRQIVAGLAGFLVYKLAVLSAAFRPVDSTLNK